MPSLISSFLVFILRSGVHDFPFSTIHYEVEPLVLPRAIGSFLLRYFSSNTIIASKMVYYSDRRIIFIWSTLILSSVTQNIMILIRDAYVVDGTGAPKKRADVLVKGNRISAIGKLPKKNAKTVIDGSGGYVLPGFIDISNESDHYLTLFTNPSHADLLRQGITTIIGGNAGASLAPLLYGSLESIRKWTGEQDINIDWHTVKEFLHILKRQKRGIHFGTLVGHSTIRRSLTGEHFRDLSIKENVLFMKLLARSLKEGAFGLSSGLGFSHSKNVPVSELKILASVVAAHKKVFAMQLRDDEDKITASVNEALTIARDTGVRTIISHFVPQRGNKKYFEESLALIESEKNADVRFVSFPFKSTLSPIYTLLPKWAQEGTLETMARHVTDTHTRERIMKELPGINAEECVIARAPGHDYLAGETLAHFCENEGLHTRDGLLKLMRLSKLRAVVFHENLDISVLIKSLRSSRALIASHAPSFGLFMRDVLHERMYETFPRFLSLSEQKKLMSFEQAVQKITGIPAEMFHLEKRGVLKEGNFADIAIMKNGKITHTIVDGEIAVQNGDYMNTYSGNVLFS
jgi:N-acyl-D-amino-acid deacylase